MLVKTLADIKQQYTQFGGIRPFGCALFFIAIDPSGSQIYTTLYHISKWNLSVV
ncbi:MAG: hypothetical protein ACTSQU_17140 [Promethearchaeota archaeon]